MQNYRLLCNGLHRRVRWVVHRGCLATEEIAASDEGDGADEETSSSPENILMMEAINVYKEPIVNVQAMKVLSAGT
uniref:Uncharacterized protein n=1 Tax=Echinococcus granulosus TaxID=6210 RepID=A0A068X575_ECHGR|nr:hypothetical protein EgrG_002058600 [Echinococcus granulosus]